MPDCLIRGAKGELFDLLTVAAGAVLGFTVVVFAGLDTRFFDVLEVLALLRVTYCFL